MFKKNNEKEEETECEVAGFDHVYETNDDTDFKTELSVIFACL